MSYVDWSSLNESTGTGFFKLSNVDHGGIRTFTYNLITRYYLGGHQNNMKYYNFVLLLALGFNLPFVAGMFLAGNILGAVDYLDQAYFTSLYKISPKIEKMLLKWISDIDDACLIDDSINNTKRKTVDFAPINNLAMNNTDKAVDNSSISRQYTSCTAFYKLYKTKKLFYILYFTFTEYEILNVKVLCSYKPKSENIDDYYVTEIPEFNTLDYEEYSRKYF